jgi:hypothetical protein
MDANSKYKYINIEDFDIKNITINEDENLNTYTIYYNDNFFYLTANGTFKSYGLNINKRNDELNKLSIIFDDRNKNNINLKLIIVDIYVKLKKNLKCKIYNPINEKYNTIYVETNNNSLFYRYVNDTTNPVMLSYNEFVEYINFPFTIIPIIYFKKFSIKNNVLYFNFGLKSAVIIYEECPIKLNKINEILNDKYYENDKKGKQKINETSSSKLNIIKF